MLTGVWLFAESFMRLGKQSKVRSWPTVEGTIIHPGVDNSASNMPSIIYRFAVDGTEYFDTTTVGAPGFGGKRKRWEYSREILKKYPESSIVTIHYNPANPEESAIRTSVSFEVYSQLSFGICLAIGGLMWIGVMLRRKVLSH